MLADRYGLPVTTASQSARDAFVEGYERLFMVLPTARAAFEAATAEDPNFVLAHLGAAQAAALQGDIAKMQASLAAAKAAPVQLTEREASQLAFFVKLLTGQTHAALATAAAHVETWPRDAAVMNHYPTILGLISQCGPPGSKRKQAEVMDAFAPHYGDDWWYAGHHAMALSEVGRFGEARTLAEYALAVEPSSGWAAHSRAHIAYEDNEPDGARPFLAAFLKTAPREGAIYGHVAWHLALSELHAGNHDAAMRWFQDAVAPEVHTGIARTKVTDTIQFLWRWELAGHPHDPARWQALNAFAHTWLPRAGSSGADIHAALAGAAAGEVASMETRLSEMDALEAAERYPRGGVVQAVVRGLAAYARGDHAGAVEQLRPLLANLERVGGQSRAQLDMIEFTVLRACIELGRHDEVRDLLAQRRKGPGAVPVAGVH
jgi:tetratricopeptide (TPR) repeat protein